MIQAGLAGMHLTSLMIKQTSSMKVTKNITFTLASTIPDQDSPDTEYSPFSHLNVRIIHLQLSLKKLNEVHCEELCKTA